MKIKSTLMLLTLTFFSTGVQSQCLITPGCTPSTVAATPYCTTPLQNTNLPNATAAASYSTVMQLSMGGSTLNSVHFSYTGTSSVSALGLPAGLSFSVNPINVNIYGGSSACILLSGTPTTAGNYTITLLANDLTTTVMPMGGPGLFRWKLTIDPATGISVNNANSSTFYIAPNPVTSELVISSGLPLGKIQISDALGKIVLSQDANATSHATINVEHLNKGVYFIQTNNGLNIVTKKFIKE